MLKATTRVFLEEGGTEQTKSQNWTSGHYWIALRIPPGREEGDEHQDGTTIFQTQIEICINLNLIPNCIRKPIGTTWICKCIKCIKCINVLNTWNTYNILIWRKGGEHRETRPIRGPVPPYPLGPPIGPPTAGPRKGYGIMHAHRICSPQDTATMQDDARMGNSGYVWTVYRSMRSNVPKLVIARIGTLELAFIIVTDCTLGDMTHRRCGCVMPTPPMDTGSPCTETGTWRSTMCPPPHGGGRCECKRDYIRQWPGSAHWNACAFFLSSGMPRVPYSCVTCHGCRVLWWSVHRVQTYSILFYAFFHYESREWAYPPPLPLKS